MPCVMYDILVPKLTYDVHIYVKENEEKDHLDAAIKLLLAKQQLSNFSSRNNLKSEHKQA